MKKLLIKIKIYLKEHYKNIIYDVVLILINVMVVCLLASYIQKYVDERIEGGQNNTTLVANDRNYLYEADLDFYNASYGYELSANGLYSPYEINYSMLYDTSVSLGSNETVVVRTTNDSLDTIDETWDVDVEINSPVQVDDYIHFTTPNFTVGFKVVALGNKLTWSRYSYIVPENYYYNFIYLPTYQGYNAEGFQWFRTLMFNCFKQVPYNDYGLNISEWVPTQYLKTYSNFIFNTSSTANPDLSFVSNPVYGNSYKILDNTLFSINGRLYTDLLVHCQHTINARYFLYEQNYTDFEEIKLSSDIYFADFVYAYNNASEHTAVIYNVPYEDIDNVYHVYSFEAGFLNSQLTRIRLFDRHLAVNVLGTLYTNGNVLLVNGVSYTQGISNADLGNVFNLFTDVFKGLSGLFSIAILPNITLGMLLFLPLIAIIIFSLIRVIKK